MNKLRRKNQSGFTLVEAILGTAIMLLVFTLFGAFMLRFTKSAADYNETAKQATDSGLTVQTVSNNLELAGANLTLSSKQSFTGEFYVPFLSYAGYTVEGHRIINRRARNPLSSSIVWNGKGQLKWRGSQFDVLVDDGNAISRRILNENGEIEVYENGTRVARASSASEESQFSIVVSSVIVNGAAVCRNLYTVDEQPLYENSGECAASSQSITVNIFQNGYIDEMKLNAAEIILRESSTMPVHLPLLPNFDGRRMESVFVRSGDGFLIFSGDPARDSMFLKDDKQFVSGSEDYLRITDATGLVADDMLLVCDYLNGRSIMLKAVRDGGTDGEIVAVPVIDQKSAAPGFEKFTSSEDDFAGYVFPKGTRVVKLAVPVEYRIQNEDRFTSLYRRSGNGSWELVVPNVQNFNFSEIADRSRFNFNVSFDVLSEGIESEQIAQPVQIAVSPRSLNRTFDAR